MAKIISITILSLFLLVGFWQSCQAVDLLIKPYPELKTKTETYTLTGQSTLPEIIRYIYMFALGAAGFVALLTMIIGGIMYVFSAGDPSKASDAKDRIFSALLGIIILLASVLILRIINPDLVDIGFSLPPLGGGGGESSLFYTQCYLSRHNLCSSSENFYRNCREWTNAMPRDEAKERCMEDCRSTANSLGGVPHCNVYDKQSECQPTGCH